MSTYYGLKVQFKEKDSNNWITIVVNNHSTLYNCGSWLRGMTVGDDLWDRGFPSNESKEEYSYHHTWITASELYNYVEKNIERLNSELNQEKQNDKLIDINKKLDCILNNTEYVKEVSDNEYYEDIIDDIKYCIECQHDIKSLADFASKLVQLYTDNYIPEENIRLLIWFE